MHDQHEQLHFDASWLPFRDEYSIANIPHIPAIPTIPSIEFSRACTSVLFHQKISLTSIAAHVMSKWIWNQRISGLQRLRLPAHKTGSSPLQQIDDHHFTDRSTHLTSVQNGITCISPRHSQMFSAGLATQRRSPNGELYTIFSKH